MLWRGKAIGNRSGAAMTINELYAALQKIEETTDEQIREQLIAELVKRLTEYGINKTV